MKSQDASNKSGGASGQTAKDFATSASGASTGRRGTAPNTLLGKSNPNQSAQPQNTNRFAKNDYFAGQNSNAPATQHLNQVALAVNNLFKIKKRTT